VVARFELRYVLPDGGDPPNDFMSRHDGILGPTPFIADGMQVGMADTAIEDVDRDVVISRLAPGDLVGNEWRI
jgi:hypothetical protein